MAVRLAIDSETLTKVEYENGKQNTVKHWNNGHLNN